MSTKRDLEYYLKIEKKYNDLFKSYEENPGQPHNPMGEMIDICFHYMSCYINGYCAGVCMFLDEFENYRGSRRHEDVLKEIDVLIEEE